MRMALVFVLLAACTGVKAATFTVSNTGDSGAGTLRQAVLDSNAAAGADLVTFNVPTPAVITMASSILVSGSLEIQGPGARLLTINAAAQGYRFCRITNGATLSFSDATVIGFSTPIGI